MSQELKIGTRISVLRPATTLGPKTAEETATQTVTRNGRVAWVGDASFQMNTDCGRKYVFAKTHDYTVLADG